MQQSFIHISEWFLELMINPNKEAIIPVTIRRKRKVNKVALGGIGIEFSTEVKYLGVMLDQELTWDPHL